MFSSADVREISQLFPSPTSHLVSLPTLILASNGQGFITIRHLQSNFENRVKLENARLSVSGLSKSLEVESPVIIQLVRSHPKIALLNSDGGKVLPQSERNGVGNSVREMLSRGLLPKQEFASQKDIDLKSLDSLLEEESELVEYDGHVWTASYEQKLSDSLLDILTRAINNVVHSNLTPHDASQLPGSPPMWLVFRQFKQVIQTHNLEDDVFVRDTPHGIHYQSKKVKETEVKAWVQPLLAGEVAYINLQTPLQKSPEVFESIKDVQIAFSQLADVDIMGTYALSRPWQKKIVAKSLQDLHYNGIVNVIELLRESVPDSLQSQLVNQVETSILLSAATEDSSLSLKLHHTSPFILTEEKYTSSRTALLQSATKAAHMQWHLLQTNHNHPLKLTLPSESTLHTSLLKDKPTEKSADDTFWSTISTLESQNELAFSTFFTDRLTSRIQLYKLGLTPLTDAKLQSQLALLLATHMHTEAIPDTLAKARAQGLVLGRKTRKNVAKLENALLLLLAPAGTLELAGDYLNTVTASLDTFCRKQNVQPTTALDTCKESMLADLRRRFSKAYHKSSADGPVLFLTLVILLSAKYHEGVVYATGKFAPKLLKALKGALSQSEYEMVEGWKEKAKAGTLSGEDREGMRKMAEA